MQTIPAANTRIMGTIDNIILNIMDLRICTRLTVIETLNGIFFVYYSVEQLKSLIVTCKQSDQIIWKHTWQFLADEMQMIPAAVHAYGDYR